MNSILPKTHPMYEPPDEGMPEPEVTYWDNGVIRSIDYRNHKGKLHRTNDPAIQWWYKNGELHSEEYWENNNNKIK